MTCSQTNMADRLTVRGASCYGTSGRAQPGRAGRGTAEHSKANRVTNSCYNTLLAAGDQRGTTSRFLQRTRQLTEACVIIRGAPARQTDSFIDELCSKGRRTSRNSLPLRPNKKRSKMRQRLILDLACAWKGSILNQPPGIS